MATQRLEIPLPNDRKIIITIDVEKEVVSVSGARLVQDVGINKLHVHPYGKGETVNGRRLRPGEVLQRGDMQNHETGNWVSIPEAIVGVALERASPSIFIRPAA